MYSVSEFNLKKGFMSIFTDSSSSSSIKGSGENVFKPITWSKCKTYPEMIGFIARGAFNTLVSTLSTIISTGWNLGRTIVQFFMIDKAAINVMKALKWCVVKLWDGISKVFDLAKNLIVNDFTKKTWKFTVELILTPVGSLIKNIFIAIYENVIEPVGKFLGSCCCSKRKTNLPPKNNSDQASSSIIPAGLTDGLKFLAKYTIYPLNDYLLSPGLNLISSIFKSSTSFVGSVIKTTGKWTAVPAWDWVVYPTLNGIGEFFNVFFRADTTKKPEKKSEVEDKDKVENKDNVEDKDKNKDGDFWPTQKHTIYV